MVIEEAVKAGSDAMTKGSVRMRMIETLNETMPEDVTAVLTLAACDATHQWGKALANMEKLHIALTGEWVGLCRRGKEGWKGRTGGSGEYSCLCTCVCVGMYGRKGREAVVMSVFVYVFVIYMECVYIHMYERK